MKSHIIFCVLTIICCSCGSKVTRDTGEEPMDYAIAYNVLVDENKGDYEVFTMNLDGTEKRNITNVPGVEWTYTSFGKHVYFISDQDTCQRCFYLYESDVFGNSRRKVSNLRLTDSWMDFRKNGTELIVNPHRSVDSVFLIITTAGELVHRLDTGLPAASDPLFINDGTQVAFRGGTEKSKRIPGYQEAIYKIEVDGSGLMKLTEYPASDTTAPWYAYKAGPPRLHPKEYFISFASFRDGKYSLYGVTTDGQKQWKLYDHDTWEVYHDWSPDGQWLVTDASNPDESQYDIGLLNWETKEWRILTDTTYHFHQSPNFVLKKP